MFAPMLGSSFPSMLAICLAAAGLLAAFSIHRIVALMRTRGVAPAFRARPLGAASRSDAPRVLVQLPLYDERHVAQRAIEALGALEWPRERLRIQVLDDSTDETREIVDRAVARVRAKGVDVDVLRRSDRRGFKAGALADGLRADARRGMPAELVAVFDADFVPAPDFLRRVVPELADPAVGAVQARWDHLDRDAGRLSRAQAVLLDAHFAVEHAGRARAGLWWNFNGTAGVWRRAAIESAGGWQHDTLTEDLDLSYRAQLAGWRLVFRPDVAVPAELPATYSAFLAQQERWARGTGQVLRKLGFAILLARAPWHVRLEALASLVGNGAYLALFAYCIVLPFGLAAAPRDAAQLAGLGFLVPLAFFARGQVLVGRRRREWLRDVPLALLTAIAMGGPRAAAFIRGLVGPTGVFVRTPKSGGARASSYRAQAARAPWFEFAAGLWLTGAAIHAVTLGAVGAAVTDAILAAGFASGAIVAWVERARAHTTGAHTTGARTTRAGSTAARTSAAPTTVDRTHPEPTAALDPGRAVTVPSARSSASPSAAWTLRGSPR